MSDNLRRYRAIDEALMQLHPVEPMGRLRQSIQVLAMFINGIVASKSTHTRKVAKKAPGKAKVTSREKRLSRWYQNKQVSYEWHMLPFVENLLAHLSSQTLGCSKKINNRGVGAGLAPARTRPDHSGRPQGHAPTRWGT